MEWPETLAPTNMLSCYSITKDRYPFSFTYYSAQIYKHQKATSHEQEPKRL